MMEMEIARCSPTTMSSTRALARTRGKRREQHRPSHFVRLLWKILEGEHEELIRWTNDGERFRILDQERLAVEVLPRFFTHRNFSSFQRQLNYFGFRRCHRTRPMVYTHVHFRRDQPELMCLVTRSTNKKIIELSTQKMLEDYRLMTGRWPLAETQTTNNANIMKQSASRYLSIDELTSVCKTRTPPSDPLFVLAKLATSTPKPPAGERAVRDPSSFGESLNEEEGPGRKAEVGVGTRLDLHVAPKQPPKPDSVGERGSLNLEETMRSLPGTCVVRSELPCPPEIKIKKRSRIHSKLLKLLESTKPTTLPAVSTE